MTLANKVQQFAQDTDLAHQIIHGPAAGAGSTVETEGGPVRTFAKIDADLQGGGYVAQTLANVQAAQDARAGSEAARDAALIQAGVYATEAAGRAAVADGQAFKVQGTGDVAAFEYRRTNAGASVLIATYPSKAMVDSIDQRTAGLEDAITSNTVWAVADDSGAAALSVDDAGNVRAPLLQSDDVQAGAVHADRLEFPASTEEFMDGFDSMDFSFAVADEDGNIAMGVLKTGEMYLPVLTDSTQWKTLSIGSDDSIAHIGDSFTASHYCLKDKAFISQLSELSPYRHQNFGVSGNDALDMQYRIVNGANSTGMTFDQMKARYAFITTLANDAQFVSADLTYYAENVRRLVETVRACGTEPIITTEFQATDVQHALLRRIADEYGCAFVDCTILDAEISGLDLGPFHQGHPGTRTGGVFWLPMLAFIDRMPKPQRAIKVFRRRSTYAVAGIADLLYKDRTDRAQKWKEITVFHYALNPQNKFEELDKLGALVFDSYADEYQKLANGQPVAFTDYALLEVTLPGTAMSLDAVEVTLGTGGATPTVYVRDFLDIPASMPGRAQGATPTDATYLSKWNKPRGAWRSLGAYSKPITIAQANLRNSMQGEKLVLMIAGAVSLTNVKVRYKGREVQSDLRVTPQISPMGAELLSQPLCGNAGQLAGWTKTGAPSTLFPIDSSNLPRAPGTTTPVDGVCVISAANTIGQTVTIPAVETGRARRYLLTAWARHFPKAFLDPSLYPGIDATQVVDRIANPAGAPITTDTCDLRTLKAEVWAGAGYPGAGGAEFFGFAALQWRPVEFIVEVPPYRASGTMSFRLSCPDGEIQIAKASWKEIA